MSVWSFFKILCQVATRCGRIIISCALPPQLGFCLSKNSGLSWCDDVYTVFPCIYFMSFQAFPPLLLHLQESGRRIRLIIELDELILSVHVALWASGHRKGHDARRNNQLCAISSTTSWGIQNFLAATSVVPSWFCTSVLNSKGISLAVARKNITAAIASQQCSISTASMALIGIACGFGFLFCSFSPWSWHLWTPDWTLMSRIFLLRR